MWLWITTERPAPRSSSHCRSVATAAAGPITDDPRGAQCDRQFASEPNGALYVPRDNFAETNRDLFIKLASLHHLPAVYGPRTFVADGGLLSYGSDPLDQYRGAASYVDRILRGEKPGDLPIQEPTKFRLSLNLRTAKALGLTIPLPLQAAADEVIE